MIQVTNTWCAKFPIVSKWHWAHHTSPGRFGRSIFASRPIISFAKIRLSIGMAKTKVLGCYKSRILGGKELGQRKEQAMISKQFDHEGANIGARILLCVALIIIMATLGASVPAAFGIETDRSVGLAQRKPPENRFADAISAGGVQAATKDKLKAAGIKTMNGLRKQLATKDLGQLKGLAQDEIGKLRKTSILDLLSDDPAVIERLSMAKFGSIREFDHFSMKKLQELTAGKLDEQQAKNLKAKARGLKYLVELAKRREVVKQANPAVLYASSPSATAVSMPVAAPLAQPYLTSVGARSLVAQLPPSTRPPGVPPPSGLPPGSRPSVPAACDRPPGLAVTMEPTTLFSPSVYLLYLRDFIQKSFSTDLDEPSKINRRFKEKFEIVMQDNNQQVSYLEHSNRVLENYIAELDGKDWLNDRNPQAIRGSIYEQFRNPAYINEKRFSPTVLVELFDALVRELGTTRREVHIIQMGGPGLKKAFREQHDLICDDGRHYIGDPTIAIEDLELIDKTDEAITISHVTELKNLLGWVYSAKARRALKQESIAEIAEQTRQEFEKRFRKVVEDEIDKTFLALKDAIDPSKYPKDTREDTRSKYDDELVKRQNDARSCVRLGQSCPPNSTYANKPINPLLELFKEYETVNSPALPPGTRPTGPVVAPIDAKTRLTHLEEHIKQERYSQLVLETGLAEATLPAELKTQLDQQAKDYAQTRIRSEEQFEQESLKLADHIFVKQSAIPDMDAAFKQNAFRRADDQKRTAISRAELSYLAKIRDNLIVLLLRKVTPGTSPFEVSTPVVVNDGNIRRLGDYLHLDLTVDATHRTTPLAIRINRLQSFLQAVRIRTESKYAQASVDFDAVWWLSSYGTWHAAMMVSLYPENFLISDLRAPITASFKEILEDVTPAGSQGFGKGLVERYKHRLQEIGDLDVMSSVPVGEKVFLFAKTQTWDYEGKLFYSILFPNGQWQSWKSLEFLTKTNGIPWRVYARKAGNEDAIHLLVFVRTESDNANRESKWGLFYSRVALKDGDIGVQGSTDWQQVPTVMVTTGILAFPDYRLINFIHHGDMSYRMIQLRYDTATNSTRVFEWIISPPGAQRGQDDLEGTSIGTRDLGSCRVDGWSVDPNSNQSVFIRNGGIYLGSPSCSEGTLLAQGVKRPQDEGLPRVSWAPNFGIWSGNPAGVGPSANSNFMMRRVFFTNSADQTVVIQDWLTLPRLQKTLSLKAKGIVGHWLLGGLRTSIPPFIADLWEDNPVQQKLTIGIPANEIASLTYPYAGQMRTTSGDPGHVYFDELYLHLPLLIASRLNEAGRYEDASKWLTKVYDPLHSAETKRKTYPGFGDGSANSNYLLWLENPFNPYAFADLFKERYLLHVKFLHVQNLLDWADQLYTQDSMESVTKARERYELAASVLALSKWPDSDCQVVGTPAGQGTSGSGQITEEEVLAGLSDGVIEGLGSMSIGEDIPEVKTGFCLPTNPFLKILRWRIEVNLEKIRQNRNFAGLQRNLQPYATPVDPKKLVKAAVSAGIDFDEAIPTMPPPIYRYAFLVERARGLVTLAQQFQSTMLATIEKEQEADYSLMKARQDLSLERANVTLQNLRVKEAVDSQKLATEQALRAKTQYLYYDNLIEKGRSEWEKYALNLQWAAVAHLHVAAAIKQIATFGVGGIGEVGGALQATASAMQTEASFERRAEEWEFQRDLANHDVNIADIGKDLAEDRVGIARQEQDIVNTRLEFANDTVEFLGDKFAGKALYSWMNKNLQKLYREQLNMALTTAKAAQRALAFERHIPLDYIGDMYWDNDRRGLLGSEQLLKDIEKMEQFRISSAIRKKEIEKTFSLAAVSPEALQRFREIGVLEFATLPGWFDRDFPGHYMRLISNVHVSIDALVPPNEGIHATLSNDGISRVMTGPPFENPAIIHRLPESVALSSPVKATGLFDLRPDDPMLHPFEGSGVATSWRLEMSKGANRFDYHTIADVRFTVRYRALEDPSYRNKVLANLGQDGEGYVKAESLRFFSVRNEYPDQWYRFHHPIGSSVTLPSTECPKPDSQAADFSLELDVKEADFLPNESSRKIKNLSLVIAKADNLSANQSGVPFTLKFCPASGFPPTSTSLSGDGTFKSSEAFNGRVPYGKWILTLDTSGPSRAKYPYIFPEPNKVNIEWLKDVLVVFEYQTRVHYSR